MAYKSDHDRPVVVERGSGGAAWFIIGALVVVILGGIWLYDQGVLSGGDVDVDVNLPKVEKTQ